jgi:predicted AAA+ superfamily ATPase
MIKRELYLSKIRPFFNKNLVKVLTGMRRSGKSVLLQLIKDDLISSGISADQFIYLNFESAKNSRINSFDLLHDYISEKIQSSNEKTYILLDEIQKVDGWEKCINSLMVDFDVDIYITGSNAKLLSGELATYLVGRYVEINIYPFSFNEMIDMYKSQNNLMSENEIFLQYVKFGGMPFLFNLGYHENESLQYLTDIYNSVMLKDVIQRNNIRDVDLLDRIIKFVISNIGATFSAKSISDYMKNEQRKTAPETIYNYINACENAYLFHKVHRQNLIGRQILKTQEKFYLTDHGIREAIYGNNQRDIEKTLKNIVYMELLRRGYKVTVGIISGSEVDFVAEKRNEKIYIQVTYVMASEDTMQRETAPFYKIADNYPKYIVSMLDEIDMSKDGIKHLNIRNFLKNEL